MTREFEQAETAIGKPQQAIEFSTVIDTSGGKAAFTREGDRVNASTQIAVDKHFGNLALVDGDLVLGGDGKGQKPATATADHGKFRSANQDDPSGEIQTRILYEGNHRKVVNEPDGSKTSRWADGAVTRVGADQSVTYMDPSGDVVRQNGDNSIVHGHVKDPKNFDGKSSDPQLELERRVWNGKPGDYEATEHGNTKTYKFKDGTTLEMNRATGKMTYTDAHGNTWTRDQT